VTEITQQDRDALAEHDRRALAEWDRRQQLRREAADIVTWMEARYWVPGDVTDPEPHIIKLMPHQRVVLRYMFQRLLDTTFRFKTMLYSSIKKSGKTCIGGAVGGWAAETWGSHSDVYFMGNDATQAKERGFAALKESVELTPGFDRKRQTLPGEWSSHEASARCLRSRSRVHAIATDYQGEAGGNPVLSVWTELWGFIYKADLRFWAEMAPSPTRPNSIRFVETYAGYVGESDLLEGLYDTVVETDQHKAGRQLTVQDLIDALGDDYEPGCFAEALNPDSPVPIYVNDTAQMVAYWDSGTQARRMPWQRGEHGQRYYDSEAATLTDSQLRRLHLNEWVSAESEFVPIEWWDACKNPWPLQPGETTQLVVAMDAGVSHDCFGLVVVSRAPQRDDAVAVRGCQKWTPPAGGQIDFEGPAEAVRYLCHHFNVLLVCYDPYQLHDMATRLRDELGIWFQEFTQGGDRLEADSQLYHLIAQKRIQHDGNIDLREHIQNCAAKTQKDEESKLRLVKKSDSRKIDLAVALSMACRECLRLNL